MPPVRSAKVKACVMSEDSYQHTTINSPGAILISTYPLEILLMRQHKMLDRLFSIPQLQIEVCGKLVSQGFFMNELVRFEHKNANKRRSDERVSE